MKFWEPSKEHSAAWRKWVRSLPKKPRAVAERFDPWTLYRLKTTGDRVMIHSFADDGTLTVHISGKFNLVMFEHQVFGIRPDELEECDLPAADEPVGSAMTSDEAHDNLDVIRAAVRPDLWILGEDGKAARKQ